MTSSEPDYPKYVKFGVSGLNCQSTDKDNPDALNLEIIDTEIFDSQYSTNTKVKLDGEEVILPLKNKDNKNSSLLNLWTQKISKGVIIAGNKIRLHTWLAQHRTYPTYKVRRFAIKDASQTSLFSSGVI
ncbi:MAG: hypothetical protein EX285_05165 [Thaumarchaeota archaeon]|nr:hypothetical protein [Nitrososphaerota archaeon]